MKRKIAVFDMDETLISSDFTWALCGGRFLDRNGISYDQTLNSVFENEGVSAMITLLQNEYDIALSRVELFEALTEETLDDYRYRVTLKENASDVVRAFRDAGYFTCVLSANSPLVLEIVRERFLSELPMDAWFSTRNFPWSKGDAKVYDLISAFFGLQPQDCVLLDDAEYAIETADKINIPYIRMLNSRNYNREQFGKDGYLSFRDAMPRIEEIIG